MPWEELQAWIDSRSPTCPSCIREALEGGPVGPQTKPHRCAYCGTTGVEKGTDLCHYCNDEGREAPSLFDWTKGPPCDSSPKNSA